MVAQKNAKKLNELPCATCGVPQIDHDHDPGLHHNFNLAEDALAEYTDAEVDRWIRYGTRWRRGNYDVRLPPPDERRRIREEAGWTQEDLGDELAVSKDTVYRW